MHVCRPQVAADRLDGVAQIAHQIRMPVIEADADVEPFELVLDQLTDRRGARQRVGHHLEGDADLHLTGKRRDFLDAATRRVPLIVGSRYLLAVRNSKMQYQILERNGLRHVQRRCHFSDRRLTPRLIACSNGKGANPLPTADGLDNRRVDRMERQPEVGQPFSQLRRSAWVVVVEMCSSCEDFDGLESVTGDIGQMLACQPAFVEEMSGDAEAVIRQPPILSWRLQAAVAPAIAIPSDVPPAVPAVAQTGDISPGWPGRRSASAECTECKPCSDVTWSGSQRCRALSGFAAAP